MKNSKRVRFQDHAYVGDQVVKKHKPIYPNAKASVRVANDWNEVADTCFPC